MLRVMKRLLLSDAVENDVGLKLSVVGPDLSTFPVFRVQYFEMDWGNGECASYHRRRHISTRSSVVHPPLLSQTFLSANVFSLLPKLYICPFLYILSFL